MTLRLELAENFYMTMRLLIFLELGKICREIRLQACHNSTRLKLGADPGLSRSWESAG